MTDDAKKLSEHMDVWDQTIGCNNCNRAWWAENNTDDPTLFHEPDCELFGRRDVADYWFNLPRIEQELGHPCGASTPEEWKALAKRYVHKHMEAEEIIFSLKEPDDDEG